MSARYERSVGFNISTKAVGSGNVEILTNDYKYPENSAEERRGFPHFYFLLYLRNKYDLTLQLNSVVDTYIQ
jgi:hypothetical protein